MSSQILTNAISQLDDGTGSFPAYPGMGVSDNTIVATVNQAIAIFDKKTLERVYYASFFDFFGVAAAGPQTVYDEFSKRFFVTGLDLKVFDAQVIIQAPNPAQGTYLASKGALPVSDNFNITAPIAAAQPLNANTPLTNNLKDQIGMIASDGYTAVPGGLGSRGKGNNAAAAGAIGALFFQSRPQDSTNINGSSLIPSCIVELADGQKILANLPSVGTMKSIDPVATNVIYFAVSKDANPRSKADWTFYSYNSDYSQLEQGFPQLTVDDTSLYYISQDFTLPAQDFAYTTLSVFNKSALLTGLGPVLTNRKQFNNPRFTWGVQLRTPKTDVLQPQFFVSATNTAMRVQFNNQSIDVPYPVPIAIIDSILPHQPAPEAGPLLNFYGWLNAVVIKGSIWVIQTYSFETRVLIRWYQLDVSNVLINNTISVKDWGNIVPADPTTSVSVGAINVDRKGNMVLNFTICGPNQTPSIAYVSKLAGAKVSDIQILVNSAYSYDGANTGVGNRWGEYAVCVLDPVDHQDFYLYNEYPIQDPNFVDPSTNISYGWSTAISVVQAKCIPKTCRPCKAACASASVSTSAKPTVQKLGARAQKQVKILQ